MSKDARVSAIKKIAKEITGKGVFKTGDVIRWKRKFGHGGTNYTYAALLAGNGSWYTTANDYGATFNLRELIEQHLTASGVTDVKVSRGWSDVNL